MVLVLTDTLVLIFKGDDESNSPSSVSEQQAYLKGKRRNIAKMRLDRTNRYVICCQCELFLPIV